TDGAMQLSSDYQRIEDEITNADAGWSINCKVQCFKKLILTKLDAELCWVIEVDANPATA
ncbi:hypothetical protein ABZP36_032566, partial [Zizania latifolia]